jgi:hypothetical protein
MYMFRNKTQAFEQSCRSSFSFPYLYSTCCCLSLTTSSVSSALAQLPPYWKESCLKTEPTSTEIEIPKRDSLIRERVLIASIHFSSNLPQTRVFSTRIDHTVLSPPL